MNELSASLDNLMRVGRPVNLFCRISNEVRVHSSRILKLGLSDIVVVWPTMHEVPIPITVDQNVILEMNSDRGVLQLRTSICATRSEPVLALHLARTGDWTRSQLRLNVRIEVSIIDPDTLLLTSGLDPFDGVGSSARLAILDAMKSGKIMGEPIGAIIRDISAGGLRLATNEPLNPGSVFWIEFPLGKGPREIAALARVVWAGEEEPRKRKYPYTAGCEFLDLGLREQDNIARFVFARQAELRRWGFL